MNKRTVKGNSAMSRIIKQSKDQVISSVKKRYTTKKGDINPAMIAKDFKTVLSLLNTEAKHVDTVATYQQVHTTASLVYGIGTVAQGSADNQRTGDSIKINKIDLNLQFVFSTGTVATTSIQNQEFNWYLVRYLKTPASSGTTAFSISEFLNQDSAGNYTNMSLPNTDTNQNFLVMASGTKKIDLQFNTTSPTTYNTMECVSHNCSFHQDYSGSAATTITDGMLFLVFTGLASLNTGGVSGVLVSSRVWYIDN